MDNSTKLKILILSTHNPSYSAGLGSDVMGCLKEAGHEVDFLCRYSTELPKRSYRCIQPRSIVRVIGSKLFSSSIKSHLHKFFEKRSKKEDYVERGMVFSDLYEIHYPDENVPGLSVDRLLQSITKEYDLVITLWWFDFINSTSLKAIYDKLHCPIMIISIDMAPITGGCFYFYNCRRFLDGCGKCPAIKSERPNDFSNKNYLIKKANYQSINCAFLGNSWMNDFAQKSKLFPASKIFKIGCIIDENKFKPIEQRSVREELGLSTNAIVLLARSSKELRKGARFVISAIGHLSKSISNQQSITLLSIGDDFIMNHLDSSSVCHKYLGRVTRKQLIKLYQAADLFLSPSVDDAGPSMINQAQMCGTPVVCFNNGSAVDVVINGESGFKTDDVSEQGFADVLEMAIKCISNSTDKRELRNSTREIAIRTSSNKSFQEKLIHYYKIMAR